MARGKEVLTLLGYSPNTTSYLPLKYIATILFSKRLKLSESRREQLKISHCLFYLKSRVLGTLGVMHIQWGHAVT